MSNAYDFSFTSIDGDPLPLSTFKGKPVLVVNTASRCGLTPQYEGLEQLYRDYKSKGLVVLGGPWNQSAGQAQGGEVKERKCV
jgi:glutathione peroxidase